MKPKRKVTVNKLSQLKAKYKHKEKIRQIRSEEQVQKIVAKKEKDLERIKNAKKGKTTRSVARSSAAAAAATSSTLSDAEARKAEALHTDYDLITGNKYGTNAVDSDKTGSKGTETGGATDTTTGFTGW